MHGSAIAILWLHYPACAETPPGPSYDGASSTILCQDTPCHNTYARTTILRRDLPLSFFTALITSLRAFNAFDFLPNTTYHLDTTYRPSLIVRINPT